MKIEFDIPQLLALAQKINYQPLLASAVNRLLRARPGDEYEIALKEATQVALGYQINDTNQFKDYGYGKASQLAGLPIFQPLVLKGFDGLDDMVLESAVVSYQRQRNIVKTVVQGRDTSVKEFINNGDWAISVSGLICRNGFEYPIDAIDEFNQFMERKATLEVVHEVLNALGVYEIVIEDYSLASTSLINCQPYSFNATSDTPITLKLDDLANSGV